MKQFITKIAKYALKLEILTKHIFSVELFSRDGFLVVYNKVIKN